MKLNINSPAYYTQKFGVDEWIYSLNRQIEMIVAKKRYTDIIDTIGIVPIIAPKEVLEKGEWKERIYISKAYKFADIQLHIDYDVFIKSTQEDKRQLYMKNIIDSIRMIGKKIKKDFNADEMINDIVNNIDSKLDNVEQRSSWVVKKL